MRPEGNAPVRYPPGVSALTSTAKVNCTGRIRGDAMKILKIDRRNGTVKIRVDSENDLWTLYSVVVPGDRVDGYGHRRAETPRDKIRSEKGEKKGMNLGLRVEKVEYHEFSNYLRILGVIIEGPQDLGQHHTLNVDLDSVLTLGKESWAGYHLELLRKAEKSGSRPNILILSVEDDSVALVMAYPYGLKEVSTVEASGIKGQGAEGGGREAMYAEAVEKAAALAGQNTPVVLVGPGFMKENLRKHAVERGPHGALFGSAPVVGTGSGGMAGAREALERGALSRVVRDHASEREAAIMEELFAEISRERGLAEYGESQVMTALERGAAHRVLATSEYLKGKCLSGPEWVRALEEMCSSSGATLEVLSSSGPAGERLDSLGGLATLLRFRSEG